LNNEEGVRAIRDHAHAAIEKHYYMSKDHEGWVTALEHAKNNHRKLWEPTDHPGCMLTGTLHLNRVPGRFYIQARGDASGHDIDITMTNMSHEINHLSFERMGNNDVSVQEVVPPNFERSIRPFDGNVYINEEMHESYHHHLKLIPANMRYYQVIQSSQVSYYHDGGLPEAKFVLDFSPIAVTYRRSKRPWYDYVTSLFAIIGGAFTIVGMFESFTRVTRSKILQRGPQQQRTLHYKRPPGASM
jgi:hypothetical protein